MGDAASTRWRLADSSGMRVQRFDDEALVFNPLTWETHLLNGTAMRVLEALSAGPVQEALLVAGLCGSDAGDGDRDATRVGIERFLRELESLGLIETVEEVQIAGGGPR